MREGWRLGRLGDLVAPDSVKVPVEPGESYPIVGVLGFGRGLLHRDPVVSSSTSYKYLHRIKPGYLVYSKLKAFEGAITVAPANIGPVYASPEFPTFSCTSATTPAFVHLLTQQPQLWESMAGMSKGVGGRRERLDPKDLLLVPVVIPPLDEQRRVVDLIGALDDAIEAAEATQSRLTALTNPIRDVELWATPERTCLSELCDVDGSLVSPAGENARLPHVGAERIVSGTGELVGVTTAAEDGVTSGKYRFGPQHVVYSKIRPNLRKVAMPDFDGLCSADAYPLLPATDVPRRYLQQLLLSRPFTEAATSRSGRTKMPKINRTELLSIPVPKTSAAAMRDLASRLDAVEQGRLAAADCANAARNLRSNLLTTLLSGEHEIPASYDELLGS